jgi:hypothetical protein
MYYEEMLTISTKKTKVSWNIINNEIGCVPNKKFTHSELRDGNVKIHINKAARSFNSYFIGSVDKLISQHFNSENCANGKLKENLRTLQTKTLMK